MTLDELVIAEMPAPVEGRETFRSAEGASAGTFLRLAAGDVLLVLSNFLEIVIPLL